MNNITEYQQRLMQAFGFDSKDLYANRTGEMSDRQLRRLQPTSLILNGVVIIALVAIFGLGLVLFLTNSLSPFLSTIFIFVLFGGVFVLWPWLKSQQETNETNNQPVAVVRGSLSLETGEVHATSRYYAVIQGIRFPVKEPQIRFLQEGDLYRIYYTTNEKILLSLEWEQVKPLGIQPGVAQVEQVIPIPKPQPAIVNAAVSSRQKRDYFSVPNPRVGSTYPPQDYMKRSAVPSVAQQQRSVQTLMATFSFNAADLDLNRTSRISDRQVEKLTFEVQKWKTYTLLALLSAALLIVIAPWMTDARNGSPTYVFALMAFAASGIVGLKWLQLVLDRTDRSCKVIEGKITHAHGKYDEVIIGSIWFRVNTYEDYALSASESYRIFYAPRSRMILSAEALP